MKNGEKVPDPHFWIYYNRNGKRVSENSQSEKEADAWRLLKKRHGEIDQGKPVGPDIHKTTFGDLALMLVNDYKANGRRSLDRCEDAINHLRTFFQDQKAVDITGDRVTAYIAYRQGEKASNATINAETDTKLRRAFLEQFSLQKIDSKKPIQSV